MTRVLVTGATGFVGRVLSGHLAERGYVVRAALRVDRPLQPGVAEGCVVGELSGATEWMKSLEQVDLVVHAAGLAHLFNSDGAQEARYMEVNADATRRLAEAASRAGVRRFVFLSSIKVNGEYTNGRPFGPNDPAEPRDAYARSKLRAEEWLRGVGARSGMEVVIVRPPLVYGCGVRANFLRLLRWVDSGRPLPLGMVHNRRSLVSVWNLSSLVGSLLEAPADVGRLWMVSDGEDLSTAELISGVARALQRPLRLLSVPVPLLRLCGMFIGRGAEVARLCDSLTVDIDDTRMQLHWTPPYSVEDSLRRTAVWYRGWRP